MFACGHSFCLKCLALLLDDPNFSSLTADPNLPPQLSPLTLMRPKKNNVKCPLCRKCASVSTISFVTTENRELEVSSKNVVGDIKVGNLSWQSVFQVITHVERNVILRGPFFSYLSSLKLFT